VFTKAAFDAFVAARSAEGAKTVKLSKAVVADEKPAKAPAKKAAPAAKKAAPAKKTAAKDEAK